MKIYRHEQAPPTLKVPDFSYRRANKGVRGI